MQLITVDFDGTLFEEDSFTLMFKTRSKDFGLREWGFILFGTVQSILIGIFKGKQALRSHFFKVFAKTFKGKNRNDLEVFFQQLITEKQHRINKRLVEKIQEHIKNGNQVIILSGALKPFLEALIRNLQLNVTIIGTDLFFDETGTCTGETGTLVNGEEKVQAVKEWIEKHQKDNKIMQVWAYADSESDIPLLEYVEKPIIVNPKGNMREIAKQNQWPIFGETG